MTSVLQAQMLCCLSLFFAVFLWFDQEMQNHLINGGEALSQKLQNFLSVVGKELKGSFRI